MKINVINASFLKLVIMTEACSIPPKEELTNTRIGCDIEWYLVAMFFDEYVECFLEQKIAIETCQKSIDSYCDILQSTRFTK